MNPRNGFVSGISFARALADVALEECNFVKTGRPGRADVSVANDRDLRVHIGLCLRHRKRFYILRSAYQPFIWSCRSPRLPAPLEEYCEPLALPPDA